MLITKGIYGSRKKEEIMEDYAGKTVVITGGTSGLGFALAKILGGRGASIVITGRREEKGAEAVEKLQAEGVSARYLR